uniref:WH1 domain-containing protein n=1 Tax=Timema cristinae TaxID=61476 RepID=A0A7R9D353_TIMCR|nr:unnamed protein product [Timema cristinae]
MRPVSSAEHRGSTLLQHEENEQIFRLLGSRCQTLATAVVQLFLTDPPDHSAWRRRDSGVLCLVKDNQRRSYFFRLFCLSRRQMVWEHEVYNTMDYKSPKPFLHTFEAEECIAAFNFAQEEEAIVLRNILLQKLEAKKRRSAGEFTALTPLHSPPPVVVQHGRLVTQPPPPPANTTHLPLTYIHPFSFEAVDKLDNSLQTEFLDLKYDCEAKIIFKQSGYELGWVKIMDTYPQLWGKTEPLLISFPSTYLVEKGFSSVVQLLTKQRNKLDICLKGDLRLNLTNIKPDIQALTEIH